MHILLVDDERSFVKGLKHSLRQNGFSVDGAYDGEEALEKFLEARNRYDLILLDLMLPEVDGWEVCRKLRSEYDVPIIMLTARDDDIDKVVGLELGADDYLTKPFNFRELLARIKALQRRISLTQNCSTSQESRVLEVGPIKIDVAGRRAWVRGEEIDLTAKEFDLLRLFLKHPGRVFTRENLMDMVWGYEHYGSMRTIDVHIRRLRQKVERDSSEPSLILTRWGSGYYFNSDVAEDD